MNNELDELTRGWCDADDAIINQLPGYKDLSQGNTDWDKGWNARINSGCGFCQGICKGNHYISQSSEGY